MDALVMTALRKASEVRRQYGFDSYQPINVFDLCVEMEVTVRLVDINMEGMYFVQDNGSSPQILISNQRPIARRAFTCAHELGHHLFEHGSKIDDLSDGTGSKAYDKDEFLVDTFAGALLMPVSGIMAEFAKRNWNIKAATPLQFYTIASVFGTGYQSLIVHCQKNKLISDTAANSLSKQTPSRILTGILGSDTSSSHFRLIDSMCNATLFDIEVGNFVIMPSTLKVDANHLKTYKDTDLGTAYVAQKPGISCVNSDIDDRNYMIRIQKANYAGLAEYRHLEDTE